jgi:hypothetical protein
MGALILFLFFACVLGIMYWTYKVRTAMAPSSESDADEFARVDRGADYVMVSNLSHEPSAQHPKTDYAVVLPETSGRHHGLEGDSGTSGRDAGSDDAGGHDGGGHSGFDGGGSHH